VQAATLLLGFYEALCMHLKLVPAAAQWQPAEGTAASALASWLAGRRPGPPVGPKA
jgi:hypothetical protein